MSNDGVSNLLHIALTTWVAYCIYSCKKDLGSAKGGTLVKVNFEFNNFSEVLLGMNNRML